MENTNNNTIPVKTQMTAGVMIRTVGKRNSTDILGCDNVNLILDEYGNIEKDDLYKNLSEVMTTFIKTRAVNYLAKLKENNLLAEWAIVFYHNGKQTYVSGILDGFGPSDDFVYGELFKHFSQTASESWEVEFGAEEVGEEKTVMNLISLANTINLLEKDLGVSGFPEKIPYTDEPPTVTTI